MSDGRELSHGGTTSLRTASVLAPKDLDRVPALAPRAAHVRQAIRDKLVEHTQYIATHGEDMPEIRNWRWGL